MKKQGRNNQDGRYQRQISGCPQLSETPVAVSNGNIDSVWSDNDGEMHNSENLAGDDTDALQYDGSTAATSIWRQEGARISSRDEPSAPTLSLLEELGHGPSSPRQEDDDDDTDDLLENVISKDSGLTTTLMTPHELESMPEEGLEFEASVGPKQPSSISPGSPSLPTTLAVTIPSGVGGSKAKVSAAAKSTVVPGTGTTIDGNKSIAGPETSYRCFILNGGSSDTYLFKRVGNTDAPGTCQLIAIPNTVLGLGQQPQTNSNNNSQSLEREGAPLKASETSDQKITTPDNSNSKPKPVRPKKGPEFPCTVSDCEKVMTSEERLKTHLMSHSGERPYKCTFEKCGWAFKSLYKLRRHMLVHQDEKKPFVCDMEGCGKRFSTVYNLKKHTTNHYRPNQFTCDYEGCGEAFQTQMKLDAHKRKHYQDRDYKCTHKGCDKSFYTSNALGSHLRTHKREVQDYPCEFPDCNKVFDKPCRLKLHLRSHTGERPYVCDFKGCGLSFVCLQKLTRHKCVHTGEKNFQCNFENCRKRFTRAEHLKSHMNTHTGEKPYKCKHPNCGQRFSARSSLNLHAKRHQQKLADKAASHLIYKCPVAECLKLFVGKALLKNHLSKSHPSSIYLPGGDMPDLIYVSSGEHLQAISLDNLAVIVAGADKLAGGLLVDEAAKEDYTPAEIEHQLLSTEAAVAAAGLSTGEVMTQHPANNVVTQFISDDGDGDDDDDALLSPDGGGGGSGGVEPVTRVYQSNQSGAARTDYSSTYCLMGRASKKAALNAAQTAAATPPPSKLRKENMLTATTTATTSSSSLITSSAITLRDPATGSRYVQTQLLQDDPPAEETDISFSHDLPLPTTTATVTSVSTPAGSDHSVISPELPARILQDSPTKKFPSSPHNSAAPEFSESTINLQDLE